MRILFFMPVDIYRNWPLVNDTTRYHQILPGCAFPQLAATVPEYECEIFDGLALSLRGRINKNQFVEVIKKYDLIGINAISEFTALNTEINLKIIKEISPTVKVVLGGYHATAFHTRWCEKGADFVVRNEGENTFRELVTNLSMNKPLTDVAGLTFREDGHVKFNPDRPFIEDLNALPVPRFDLLNYSLYRIKICPDGFTGSVEVSRGCPYHCNFCREGSMWKNTQRYKSVERILHELDIVLSRGVKWVWFADNSFGLNYQRDKLLCEKIAENKLKFSWGAFMRASTSLSHPDLIEAASKAGLKHVCVGYEFTNKEMLEKAKKGYRNFSHSFYKKTYDVFNKEGIFVIGLFLSGFPKENIKWNFRDCQKICDFATWNTFRPQYGTDIYQEMVQDGYTIKDMFFQNRFMASFTNNGYRDVGTKYNFRSLFSLKTMKKALWGSKHENLYIRGFLLAIAKSVFSITPNKLLDFLISRLPFFGPDEKQNRIIRRYLNKKFVQKWVGRNGQPEQKNAKILSNSA